MFIPFKKRAPRMPTRRKCDSCGSERPATVRLCPFGC